MGWHTEAEKRRKIGERRVKKKRGGEEASLKIAQIRIEKYKMVHSSCLSFFLYFNIHYPCDLGKCSHL